MHKAALLIAIQYMAGMAPQAISTAMTRALLMLNIILLAIGNCGSPLIMRLYFIHGGQRIWFSSWIQTGGWPIILLPITISYLHRKNSSSQQTNFFLMKPPVFFAAAFIGIITGFVNYLYVYGLSCLPASTSSLIVGSQLAFTACFAFLLVKQKFTPYSINAVFLLTIGAGVLALHANSDRPENETTKEYVKGFVMTIGASILYGLTLPLVELTYKKAKQQITYGLVMEMQTVMCFFATVFCTVGVLVNKDFQAIRREATVFGLGEAKYYVVVIMIAIVSQAFFLGAIGVIFCGSSFLSAVVIAVTLPITEILAVIFFKEDFQAEKGVSLALSLWGFGSYFYGEIERIKKQKEKETLEAEKQLPETEMPQAQIILNP